MLSDLHLSRGPVAAFVAQGLFWGAFAALVPVLKPQAGLSDAGFGLAMLVAAVGAFGAMWLAPWFERRFGVRAVPILAGYTALAFLVPGLTANGVAFALAMMFCAMGSGSLDVAMNARVSVLEGRSGRPLMNLAHGMFSVAYAVAALGAGFARELGASPVAIYGVVAGLTGLLVLQVLAAPVHDPERAPDAPDPPALGWALLLPGGLIILVAFMAEQATEGWSALHLERNLGAGAAEGAFGPAILGATMAVGRLSGQAAVQRFSEAQVLRLAAALSAAGALLAAWAPVLGLAYAGFAMLGLGVSVVAPMAFAWVGRLVAVEHKALAISRVAILGYAGFFVGPPIMGFLSEGFGLHASFSAMALVLLAVPVLLVPWQGRRAARG